MKVPSIMMYVLTLTLSQKSEKCFQIEPPFILDIIILTNKQLRILHTYVLLFQTPFSYKYFPLKEYKKTKREKMQVYEKKIYNCINKQQKRSL